MHKSKKGFSIVEVIISVVILSLFLIGAYSAIDSFYSVIHYIDANLNGLNITKSGIDEIIALREEYIKNYPTDGWERFAEEYKTGTFKIVPNGDSITFSKIIDKTENYEGPLDVLGNVTTNTNGIFFLRKVDIDEENDFYLKNIKRVNTGTGEILKFIFTKEIYNDKSLLLSSGFENYDYEITNNGLPISYYDLDGESGNAEFSNLSNKELKYSKIVSYDDSIVTDGNSFSLSYSGGLGIKNIVFYETAIPELGPYDVPLKIDADTNKNYYNLCDEINETGIIECEYNYFLKDNFYKKIVGISKELSNIDFGDNFFFSFSGSSNNEIWLYLDNGVLPKKDDFLFINPFYEVKHNTNLSKNYDFLSQVSDSTAGNGVLIPELPTLSGGVNTSTGYTSLLNLKVSTFLYDNSKFIEKYEIDTKIGDISRY